MHASPTPIQQYAIMVDRMPVTVFPKEMHPVVPLCAIFVECFAVGYINVSHMRLEHTEGHWPTCCYRTGSLCLVTHLQMFLYKHSRKDILMGVKMVLYLKNKLCVLWGVNV